MPFRVNIDGLLAMQERFSSAKSGLGIVLRETTTRAENEAVNQLHTNSPVDDEANNGVLPGEEGHLNESFVGDPVEVNDITSHADVRTEEPIKFQYVTQGTDSPIYPVVKKAMWWPGAAHPMYSVSGQAANPFQVPIGQDIEGRMGEFAAPSLQAWLATLEG